MDAIDAVIDRLYDGTTDAEAWSQGLTGICDLIGGGHLISMVQDAARATFPLIASVRVEARALERFLGFAPGGIAMIRGFGERRSFDSEAVMPRAELLHSEIFNEVILPMGGYRALISVPFRQNGHDSFITVCRPPQAEDFGAEEAAILDRIVPHLARAMRTKLKLDDAARRLAAALGAFDQLATGIAIVDLDLRPVVLNRRAEQIVARADGLTLSDGGLAATSPTGTSWLRRLVQRAASDDPRVAGYYTLRLERAAAPSPWSITARLLPDAAPGGRLVAVMIEEIERQPGDIAPVLIAAFGFTRREAALAVELANGNDLGAAAGRLGISVGTARNYLKAIFGKTGTHRQAELAALLLRTIRLG